MKGEIWKDIEGYEGLYQVSNMGRVKSLNYRRTGKERILKPRKNIYGYLRVCLCKNNKVKDYFIHRLVAQVFVENPENYDEINHIDENKENNKAENLEYCSRSYNMNYGTRNQRVAEKTCKPVFSVDKESGLIMYWESIAEAEKCTGTSHQTICHCLKGRQKSAGNHYWFYADDDDTE